MRRKKGSNVEHFPVPSFLQFVFTRVFFVEQNERSEKEGKNCRNHRKRQRRVLTEVKQKQKIVHEVSIHNP